MRKMTYTTKEFCWLKNQYWFRKTNYAWNKSGINHPSKVGYLMKHAYICKPNSYKEFEEYFFTNVLNEKKVWDLAEEFRAYCTNDPFIQYMHDWKNEDFCCMVLCRLVFDTYCGYVAECRAKEAIERYLNAHGLKYSIRHLDDKYDNKYAVDFALFNAENKLVSGIQVKSNNFFKSSKEIVLQTAKHNELKNRKFTELTGAEVLYVFYQANKSAGKQYELVECDDALARMAELLRNNI